MAGNRPVDEPDRIPVALIHRSSTLRDALRLLLESDGGIRVVAETADGDWPDALDSAPVTVWDSGTFGAAHAAGLLPAARQGSAPGVLVLAESASAGEVETLLAAGVDGCVLTTDPPDCLAQAVAAIARGEAWLSPLVARRVLDLYRPVAGLAPPVDDRLDVLSGREREVLRLVASGQSNAEIAALLRVTGATVKTHVSRILGKLGVRDRVQASAVAHRSGLLRDPL